MKDASILIVEDERIVAEDIKLSLETMGYNIYGIVNSGKAAIEILKPKNPDLILMDIKLQGNMTGIETADYIRHRYDIPLIYLTANSNDSIVAKARETEPYGFIQKPFDERDLDIAIDLALYKHKMEQEKKRSFNLYQSLFHQAHTGIHLADRNDRIIDVNDAFCTMMEYSREELLNMTVWDLQAPEVRREKDGVILKEQKDFGFGSFEAVNISRSGKRIPVNVQISPISTEDGELYFSIVKDITKEKQIKDDLINSEKKYHTIFNDAAVAIWEEDFSAVWKDIEALRSKGISDFKTYLDTHPEFIDNSMEKIQILNINNETLKLMETDSKEGITGSLNKTLTAETKEVFKRELIALAENKKYFLSESIVTTLKSRLVDVLIKINFPEDKSLLNRTIISITDISIQKIYEKSLGTALKEKEALLKELYHRTKNNMQVISALLTLQSSYTDNQEIQRTYNDLSDRIQAMALVHQKLYQSKDLSSINFKEYIESLIEHLHQSYIESAERIKIELEIEDVSVLLDAAIPCGLILNELITNALKHAFPDQMKGIITIKLVSMENDTIRITVKDTGGGISQKIDTNKPATLGMQWIYTIAEQQLQGEIGHKINNGTEWTLVFNKNITPPRV